jgi:acyl-CoA synthetase (NDP forming)
MTGPHFGPVIAIDLGGIFVEILEDVQFLVPPVVEHEARAALTRLRGYAVLNGVRGRAPADVDALVDAIVRFSELCLDLDGTVGEIDINPLTVLPAGQAVRAVDALIVPRR